MEGGFVTDVVRVGNTVRRAPSPNSSFVHQVLRHLEEASWPGAPRFRGIDDQGREILTFIAGHVPGLDTWPVGLTRVPSLTRLALMVRAFHDLTAGTPLAGDQEVVCHNDLSPKNTVYGDPDALVPTAFIDWDLAGPGARIHDVAHVCWQYLRLGDVDPHRAGPRMRLVCDVYGLDDGDRGRLVETVLWWQERCWRGIDEQAARGTPAMQRLQRAGVPTAIRAAQRRTGEERRTLETYP